jgi:two-component system, OmpR family, phosphate regulon sensor histidine kinase PhoR
MNLPHRHTNFEDKQLEDTRINYRYLFESLLEAAPWPVLIVDEGLSVKYYNIHAARLFDAMRAGSESLRDVKVDALIDDTAILELVQECVQTGKARSGEYEIAGSGSTWRISVSPLGHQASQRKIHQPEGESDGEKESGHAESRYRYFAIAVEDLTELRRLERVRRDFIANISHELRTPLASVRLLVETLEEAIDTDPEMRKLLWRRLKRKCSTLPTW